jgi:ABC-type transport system involved in cytochrome c biogenesis permease subunit
MKTPDRWLPWVILLLALTWTVSKLPLPSQKDDFDAYAFGQLPALVNGRVKPLDTVARTSLLVLQGRQKVVTPEGKKLEPTQWLLEMLFRPEYADTLAVIEIVNHEVLDTLGITALDRKRFSMQEINPGARELERQAQLADKMEASERSAFQREVIGAANRVALYRRIQRSAQLPESRDFLREIAAYQASISPGLSAAAAQQAGQAHDAAALAQLSTYTRRFEFLAGSSYFAPIPPPAGTNDDTAWRTVGSALLEGMGPDGIDPTVYALAQMGTAYREGDHAAFAGAVNAKLVELETRFPHRTAKARAELRFNHFQPFLLSASLYVGGFLLAIVSWMRWPAALGRAAYWLLGLAWIIATVGIITRMALEGRPPVTNLYSSAVFAGWGAVGLCLIAERFQRNAIASVVGAAAGFLSLIVAHHLSLGGDTLEMMRAVLDSNFWLASHVVVIMLGYSGTFVAGFLAIVFILRGALTRTLDRPVASGLVSTVYGIIGFATLFSLLGTVLGGIWADQSWGRFWGWDPKENGALIIVLWNALILHARWGGMIRGRGLMMLAVFGNVVTAWCWFGTNLLGVGLHSYGFMESGAFWLAAFVVSQMAIIAIAMIPPARWRSQGAAI